MTGIIARRKANNRKSPGYPPDGTPGDAFCKPGYKFTGVGKGYGKSKPSRADDDDDGDY